MVLWYKRLDVGVFEIPCAKKAGDTSVVVSETMLEAIFAGPATMPLH